MTFSLCGSAREPFTVNRGPIAKLGLYEVFKNVQTRLDLTQIGQDKTDLHGFLALMIKGICESLFNLLNLC